jgi:hypothetical protein
MKHEMVGGPWCGQVYWWDPPRDEVRVAMASLPSLRRPPHPSELVQLREGRYRATHPPRDGTMTLHWQGER